MEGVRCWPDGAAGGPGGHLWGQRLLEDSARWRDLQLARSCPCSLLGGGGWHMLPPKHTWALVRHVLICTAQTPQNCRAQMQWHTAHQWPVLRSAPWYEFPLGCPWSLGECATEMPCVCSQKVVCLFRVPSRAWPCATCCQMAAWAECVKTKASAARRKLSASHQKKVCKKARGMLMKWALLFWHYVCLTTEDECMRAKKPHLKCAPDHCSQMNILLETPHKYRACYLLPNAKETFYNC